MFIKIKKLTFLLTEYNTVSMCELFAWVKLIITKLLDSSIVRYNYFSYLVYSMATVFQDCVHTHHTIP